MKIRQKIILLLCLVLALSSCSVLKASASKMTYFLPKPKLIKEDRERAPFNGYWVYNPEEFYELKKAYGEIVVDEVDISNIIKMYKKSSYSKEKKEQRIEEAKELARYFKQKLLMLLEDKKDPLLKIKKTDEQEDKTLSLRLEIALTEVNPTNPTINILGTIGGFFLPGGSSIKYFGEGSIAMEGFVYAGDPKIPLEQFKDREGQKTYAFSFKDYQRYAHIRVALDDWAMQLAELISSPHSFKVEDSIPLSLNPF